MKELEIKLKIVLNISVVLLILVVIFIDGDLLNSIVLQVDEEMVIEEVAIAKDEDTSNDVVEQVVVNDENLVNNYVTFMNVANNDYWAWPTDSNYVITSYYGYRWGSMHNAIDISGSGYGSNIYAANNGVVVTVKSGCVAGDISCNGRGGNYVVINHNSNNYYTTYLHLKDIKVNVGDVVSRGEVIGTMGNTGNVYPRPTSNNPYGGTHLHFGLYIGEPYKGGYAVNPLSLY